MLWCNSWISSSIERTLSSSLFYFTGVYFTSLSARGGHRAARLRTLRQELARGGAQLWLVQPSDSLPFDPDPAKVEAKFDKGVLRIKLPKSAEVAKKQQKIEIKKA